MNISAGNDWNFYLILRLCTSWNVDICRLFKYCPTPSIRKIMLSHAQHQHYLNFEKNGFIFMNISAGNDRNFYLILRLCTSWNVDICRLFKYSLNPSIRKIMLSYTQHQHYLNFEKNGFIFMNISAGNGRIFKLTLRLCTSWNVDVCRLFKYCLTPSIRKNMLSYDITLLHF